jgi:hypothetical protein
MYLTVNILVPDKIANGDPNVLDKFINNHKVKNKDIEPLDFQPIDYWEKD